MKNSSEDKKFDFSKINIDTIVTFCKNNTRYISAGVLTLALAILLAVTAVNGTKTPNQKDQQMETEEKEAQDQQNEKQEPGEGKYAKNEVKDLNELIAKYYAAYAAGDLTSLSAYAYPVSDMEKNYVQLMSQYLDGYSDLDCYTKPGLEDNSYLVSVTFNMKFKGVEGALPGLDFFYVRTNEAGVLYIDNLYSSFNSQMKEQTTDEKVDALITKFQGQEDVQELKENFEGKYNKAIEADANLSNQVNTVSSAIQKWASSYDPQQVAAQKAAEEAAAQQAAAEAAAQQQAAAEAAAQQAAAEAAAQQQAAAEAAAQQAAAEQAAQQNGGGVNFIPDGTVMTASDAYNVRKGMSEASERMGTIGPGETFRVILSYAEGWTKVEWNGKTGYIRTDLLLNN